MFPRTLVATTAMEDERRKINAGKNPDPALPMIDW